MKNLIILIFRKLFVRPEFVQFFWHLYKFSLMGMGMLNAEGASVTGEQWLQSQLENELKPKNIVDVGANTDVFGIKAFPNAVIYACEPHPETFKKLSRKYLKAQKSRRLRIFNLALSDKKSKMKLWDYAQDAPLKHTQPTSTFSSLSKEVIESLHGQKAQSFDVRVTTIDAFMTTQKIQKIDLLKIDTEGFEYQVLQGAKKALQAGKIKTIQFEFNEMHAITKYFFSDFMDLLADYEMFRMLPKGLIKLSKYRPLSHEIFGFQNIFCVHKKLVERLNFLKQAVNLN